MIFFAIATVGCIANVVNADSTDNIPSDKYVKADSNVEGAIIIGTAVPTKTEIEYILGMTIENIPAGGIGKVLIMPHVSVLSKPSP